MSRSLRRSASVFLVLFALVAVEARAGNSYLFGATEEDIDATMRYYFPRGYDRGAAFRQVSAPFDCRNFGDLCRLVIDPDEIPLFVIISDTKDDAKQVAAAHAEPGVSLDKIRFAGGCGTATGSGIGEVCSCSGAVQF